MGHSATRLGFADKPPRKNVLLATELKNSFSEKKGHGSPWSVFLPVGKQ